MIQTRTADVDLRRDGIVSVTIKPVVKQALVDAKENYQACLTLSGGVRRPLLVDIRLTTPLEPEARHFYGNLGMDDSFTALAMLINSSPLGRIIGNVYLRVARHKVPLSLFTEEVAAVEWLLAHK